MVFMNHQKARAQNNVDVMMLTLHPLLIEPGYLQPVGLQLFDSDKRGVIIRNERSLLTDHSSSERNEELGVEISKKRDMNIVELTKWCNLLVRKSKF